MSAAETLWAKVEEAAALARLRNIVFPHRLANGGGGFDAVHRKIESDIAATFSLSLAQPWDKAP